MADPRLDVGYDKAGFLNLSFKADGVAITYSATVSGGSALVGRAVTMSAADTISTAADGEAVLGKLIKVDADGICTVQVKGGMSLPAGTGAALTVGKKIVGAVLVAAEGYIREVNTGTAAELGLAKGEILNAADTDAVWVLL